MVVADSSFTGLQSFGNAAMIFAASNVTFVNVTFVSSNNSAGTPPILYMYLKSSSFA